jgi:uncharacterized protein (DUF305 family)
MTLLRLVTALAVMLLAVLPHATLAASALHAGNSAPSPSMAKSHGAHAMHRQQAPTPCQPTPCHESGDSAATTAYKAANTKMHKDMDIAFTGDADADFVRGMIPHHQGAIDMAKVVLAHGKDPALKKLATSIIADQEKEIAMMRDWLKTNGK